MPIVDVRSPLLGAPLDTPSTFSVMPGFDDVTLGSEAPARPGWGPTFGAAFRQDNIVGAAVSREDYSPEDDPAFKPWEHIKGTPYEKNWQSFVDVRNQGAMDAKKRQIDRENEDRKLLDAAPWWQSLPTQMIAGVVDLPTLLPGGAFVRGAHGGFSVARSAVTTGAAAGIGAGVQETVLQSIQETRPLSESAINVGASVLLGGLLGAGGAKLLTNAEWTAAVKAIEGDAGALSRTLVGGTVAAPEAAPGFVRFYHGGALGSVDGGGGRWVTPDLAYARGWAGDTGKVYYVDIPENSPLLKKSFDDTGSDQVAPFVHFEAPEDIAKNLRLLEADAAGGMGPTSAGAAAVRPVDLDGNTIAGRAAGALAAATERLNPALRLSQSPSPAVREIGGQLFENSLYMKKNMEGVASDVAAETLMKEWNSGLVKAIMSTNAAHHDYVKAGGALKSDEFRDAVGKAMRRADDDPDPHVAKVAKEWRAKVFEPLKQAAIEAKLLPADVTVETAASYFSRMWNKNTLIAREGEFKAIVRKWVADNLPTWASSFDKGTEARLNPLRREIDDLEMGKLRRSAEAKAREEDGEISGGDFNEADIRQALRIVEGGAPKPKGVVTLTQFVHKAGGLVDFSGELATMGINHRSRPGFVRKERMRSQSDGGGWAIDDMARHAWENGYFGHGERPTPREFLDALSDDFNKHRAVVRDADRDAYRLNELIDQLEADLSRVGARTGQANRFATSEEAKGIVKRVYQAMDAEADRKIAALKTQLLERETAARVDRDARFMDDPDEAGRSIADEVFNTLTGKTIDGSVRPEFLTVTARGPLKERTFNIPDALIEQFLESDVELVGRRYARVMGADVELARKFGSPDMVEQISKVREDYARLRHGISNEKQLTKLGDAEKRDVRDLEALRDLLRGTRQVSPIEENYNRLTRAANHVNYIRSMGEVVLASITDVIRPAMVHGLSAYIGHVGQLATNMKGVKLSVAEAQLAGNVAERVLGHRLATVSEIIDPYASRGPVEAFLENMTNVASKWNGIRIWTDGMKSIASVMTQNRILQNAEKFASIKPKERAYLAYLGVDQSMAERIAAQFATHGETTGGVRVANTAEWTDPVAVRTYRAAMNKDVDSIIVQKSVADVPLFASTPTGRMLLQFKSFALASHQKVLLRGLQEDQSRFIGGTIAMTAMGMLITYLKAVSGNRPETQEKIAKNPGWWVGEGLDRSGIFSVPMEISNAFEKFAGVNPIKAPFKAFDPTSSQSQKNQNRNELGSLLGPTAGMVSDVLTVGGIPKKIATGEEVNKGQIRSGLNLLPFNSYTGVRQFLNYVVAPPQN